MNLFQMFFPLALLVVIALIAGWVIPHRRRPKDQDSYDLEAVLAHHRQALDEARQAAVQAMKAARHANREVRSAKREFQHLVENLELRSKAS
jgi:hypothetical protein